MIKALRRSIPLTCFKRLRIWCPLFILSKYSAAIMYSWRPIAHADTVNVKAGNVPQHSSVHSVRYEFVCLRCNLITKGVPVLVHDALIAMHFELLQWTIAVTQKSTKVVSQPILSFNRVWPARNKLYQNKQFILLCALDSSRTQSKGYKFISNDAYRGQ